MRQYIYILIYFTSLFYLTSLPLAASESEGYLSVTGPCNLEFPEDHGAHPDYRTEWWYYTGNLQARNGDRYGFQLTFFRSRVSPPGTEKKWPPQTSAWRTPQVYLAHAAISDISGKQHRLDEDMSRGALGLAGVNQSEGSTKVYLKNWSTRIEPDSHRLDVVASDFSIALSFKPGKPIVLHGDRGYDLKGSTPERASCYYSFTRLEGQGRISIGDEEVLVTGTAWMDHEFSTATLEPGIIGWDWFSLQFSDYSEIMVYQLRTEKGGLHAASSGTYINADGIAHKIGKEEIKIDVLDTWYSKQSGARYPVSWRLQIKSLALDARITSYLPDQEMRTLQTTGVTYWEGSVSIAGSKNKIPITGNGYVELTGYAEAFDAPI